MRPRAWASAVAAVLIVLGGPAIAQGEGFGIRLVDVPTHLADDPRANRYIVDHAGPGASVRRTVEVSNDTGSPLTVALYAAGAEVEGDEFRFAQGREHSDVSSWTTVTPDRLELAAGGRARAEVTVDVPSDAVTGEHYGVVWAEVASDAQPGAVRNVHRVGVRIYLSVGGGPSGPEADFSIVELVPHRTAKGVPRVEALVENVGGRAVDLSGELRLSGGPGGLRAGPFTVKAGTTLAPGEEGRVGVNLDPSLPAGPWETRLLLRSGSLERRGEATLTFPDQPSDSGVAVEVDDDGSSGPGGLAVALAALIAVGAGSGLLWVVVARRRRA